MNDSPLTSLERRLAGLRGEAAPKSLDARALAALAANPGCRRRAVLDAAGVDKGALAARLGAPAAFGQSPFAITRGLAFEKRLRADRCAALLTVVQEALGGEPLPLDDVSVPDLLAGAAGPAVRTERTRQAIGEAVAAGGWTLLDHPMLRLELAGSSAYLEPDAVLVAPAGRWHVIEIKSFPILDGGADPAKVGAAARQAAVYVLALRALAAALEGRPAPTTADPYAVPEGLAAMPADTALLVCPRDFSNQPVAAAVDLRKQLAVTQRQLLRLTRIEQLLDALPEGLSLDESPKAVEDIPHSYSPDCLAACELAFLCREQARCAGSVDVLGRGVRGELGSVTTVAEALAEAGSGAAGSRLARAAALRAEALAGGGR
jgi:hypothetical protein